MEIYNERIYDLLVDLSRPEQPYEFTIAEEKDGRGMIVRGLNEVEVRDEASALNLLFTGGLSRTTATHKLNKRSNRSHSIFTVYLQQRQRSGVSEKVIHSKLHLVDLAGSERLKKTMDSIDGSMGDEVTRKESMAINRSLTYLEQCVVALTRKGATHVPYRQSKLTNVLKDCLGANCNTLMVACIWGESSHLEETVSTLRLASRMMKVQNESVSVESVDPSVLLKKQEKIIKALKQELLMHDALVERTAVVYDAYTPEQQASISELIEKYVAAPEREEEDILQINTFRQMLEICKQFKKKLLLARSNSGSNSYGRDSYSANESFRPESKGIAEGKSNSNINRDGFKEINTITDPGKGFALGDAKADSRPLQGIETSTFYAASPKSPKASSTSPNLKFSPGKRGDKATLNFDSLKGNDLSSFESFVRQNEKGKELFSNFGNYKTQIKELKVKIRNLTMDVNEAKLEIDHYNSDLETKKNSRIQMANKRINPKDEVVDEDEMKIARALKESKQKYRNTFEQMQKQQNLLNSLVSEMESLKSNMMTAWNDWLGEGTMNRPASPSYSYSEEPEEPNEMDELDDQEAFDKLETERVLANDPDSLAFFMAQKTRKANLTQSGGAIRMLQKNKRFN